MPQRPSQDFAEFMSQAITFAGSDFKAHARLCREIHGLLQQWNREGYANADVTAWLIRIEAAYAAIPHPCLCDPPGSGEEWCTGHCQPL